MPNLSASNPPTNFGSTAGLIIFGAGICVGCLATYVWLKGFTSNFFKKGSGPANNLDV